MTAPKPRKRARKLAKEIETLRARWANRVGGLRKLGRYCEAQTLQECLDDLPKTKHKP